MGCLLYLTNFNNLLLKFCAISSFSYRLIFPEMRGHFCLHEPASSLLNALRTKWATTFCTYVAIRRELRECRPSNLAGLQNGIRDIGSSRYCVRCWTTSLPPAKPPTRSKLRMRTRIGRWSMSPISAFKYIFIVQEMAFATLDHHVTT